MKDFRSQRAKAGRAFMEKLSIYEYVAVIVPGVAFLFGLGVMLPAGYLFQTVLLPRDMGTAAVHLFLAFALGHLLQVVGQLTHRFYWDDFGGLPTDWPFTRQHAELGPELQEVALEVSGQDQVTSLAEWRRAVATTRSLVTADGFSSRLETFMANYGMFRSLAVGAILLLLVAPWCGLNLPSACAVIGAILIASLLGMHAFGVHYARELFAAARAWARRRKSDDPDTESEPVQTLKIVPRRARWTNAA
jgi:hypothetical protein